MKDNLSDIVMQDQQWHWLRVSENSAGFEKINLEKL